MHTRYIILAINDLPIIIVYVSKTILTYEYDCALDIKNGKKDKIKCITMCNHCGNTIETLEHITMLGRTMTYT